MRFILFIIIISITSCKEKRSKSVLIENEIKLTMEVNSFDKKSLIYTNKLSEDIAEINCYVKKIYKKNNLIFVDIDLVDIKYNQDGDRIIINKNPKIRTYIINDKTIIYSHKCETLKPKELTEIEKSILNNKSIIVVGSSKNGCLESINFGCYG